MRTSIAIATVFLFWVSVSYSADVIPTTIGSGGYASFGAYHPSEIQSLSEIPLAVRELLSTHLKSRLGEMCYQRLAFSDGQIIDVAKLLEMEPNSKKYQWEIPAYAIGYNFQLPETGLAFFPTTITLRKDGSVIKEIGLPAFGADSSKCAFLPFSSALLIATQQGFSRDKVSASLVYGKKVDSLLWQFKEAISDSGSTIEYKTIFLNAHTGEILWTGNSQSLR